MNSDLEREVIGRDPGRIYPDTRIYTTATLEDNFCASSIMVVKKTGHSQITTESTFQDNVLRNNSVFNGIGVRSITDLTALPSGNMMSANAHGLTTSNVQSVREYLETITFRQILHVELDVECRQNVLDVVRQLQRVEGIRHVGPNIYDEILALNPNNPYFQNGAQWALNGANGINAPGAWGITTGTRAVRVGIIDTGIARHPNLNANVDFTSGGDFYRMANIPNNIPGTLVSDTNGHGTMSAGVVGAEGNIGIGVTGVAQHVTLVPMQSGYGVSHSTAARVRAIMYARNLWGTSRQISILNHSIGGFGTNIELLEAVRQFPGLFVWSVGNHGVNIDSLPNIAQFRLPNLISVGAVNESGNRGWYRANGTHDPSSNYGRNSVDIFAPAGVWTTTIGSTFSHYMGTSAAAPHVAGTAALMLSIHPGLTPARAAEIIRFQSDRPAGWDNNLARGGRLNAARAVQRVRELYVIESAQDLHNIRNSPNANFTLGNNINLSSFPQWTPIHTFRGHLYGNGHTISNLNITRTINNTNVNHYFGLFERVYGSVRNLTITNSNIAIRGDQAGSGWINAGLIAGNVGTNGRIERVRVIGTNQVAVYRHQSRSGGISAAAWGTLRINSVTGLFLRGNGNTGGIVGESFHATIANNNVTGIRVWNQYYGVQRHIGIIVGRNYRSSLSFNNAAGSHVYRQGRENNTLIGGIMGVNVSGTNTLSQNTGNTQQMINGQILALPTIG
ncbi:MAG: S8 family serine peptidase [Firmicutes bacterium]|nr:S8 family serine peptidase [Bacillota bacterium]